MSLGRRLKALHLAVLLVIVAASALAGNASVAGVAAAPPAQLAPVTRVAYIYNTNIAARDSFNTLLTGRGLQVDLVSLSSAATASFAADQAIIVGDDTGNLSSWGTPAAVSHVNSAGKPILGVGEGGYAFFGRLSLAIGWGNGAHGSAAQAYAVYPTQSIYAAPNPIAVPANRLLSLYTSNQSAVEIFGPSNPLAAPIGRDPTDRNYLPLTSQRAQSRCYTLWGYSGAPTAMTITGKDLFVNLLAGQPCAPLTLASSFASTPPTIDGVVDYGEWPSVSRLPFGHGFLSVVNDGIRLYALVDVLDDNTNDPPLTGSPYGDYFWLIFDVNRDGAITSGTDRLYSNFPGTYNLRYSFFLGPHTTTGLQPGPIRSSLGPGFGCFFGDGTLSFISFFPPRINCASHRVWEFGIDLREIGAQPGGAVRMGLRSYSQNPSFTENIPVDPDGDFTNLTQVALASATLPASSGASVSFQANPIEVTQAIQTPSNAMPLVADKATVARTYVRSNGPGSEPAIVYLYGSRGGADLPGSPLAALVTTKTAPNRANLADSASFLLPRAWIGAGGVTFQAGVARLSGGPSFSSSAGLTFQTRRPPVYWVVPVNTGTNATPNVVGNATIASQESYLRTVYPVPGVTFVQKPWQDLGAVGPINLDQTIQRLNTYRNSAVLAWILGVIFGGKEPFTLPDQIYGFRNTGGGLSDPVWLSGNGYVAAGFLGTSLEGTMAHELNHNLDRDATGTWGRHVGGCGADGPYPSWPYPNTNIQEVGFDTRLPWSSGGSTRTAIPNTFPDFMSYCQSGQLPTKWISPFRWQNLFNVFAPPAVSTAERIRQIQQQGPLNYYYVSGVLNKNGTGKLDPVLVQPGLGSTDVVSGSYSIEIQAANGSPLGQPLNFAATFTDPEGNPRNSFYFSFQIPEQPSGAKIVLKHGSQVLDTITKSNNAPSVTVTAPNGGEQWSGTQTITWSASDADSDSLSFTILYSPDNGSSWFPVASSVTGNSYQVDTGSLPGGSEGKIRVIVTDGFNNNQDDSDAFFTIAGHPPAVTISSPQTGAQFNLEQPITFQGDATDLEDSTIPENSFTWSYAPAATSGTQATATPTIFGSGRQTSITLPGGTYEITLTVTDSNGNSGTAKVTVVVNGPVYLPLIRR